MTVKKKNVSKDVEDKRLKPKKTGKLIIEGHDKNPFVIFWNWGWGIYYKNPEMWNYLIAGGVTTFISVATKLLLLATCLDQTNGVQLQIAEIISWAVGVTVAFALNKLLVFKSKSKNLLKEISSFVSGRIFTQLIQMLIMFIFVTCLKLDSNLWVVFFTFFCQVMQIVVNYFISKFIVFKKKD